MKKEPELSGDQKDVLEAMDALKPGGMLFLTGRAGTGKSFLIDRYCDKHRNVVKLAPTGVAAQNIEGRTIHSFLGIVPGKWMVSSRRMDNLLFGVDAVIVDEISMVDVKLFETLIKAVTVGNSLSEVPKIIMVGDFNQLPPVDGDFCYKSHMWRNVWVFELVTPHRQDEADFLNVLDKVREGDLDNGLVRDFIKESSVDDYPEEAVVITPYRKKALTVNNGKLRELGTEVKTNEAKVLKGSWRDNKIPKILQYAEGARIMMLNNHPEGQWVNGSMGWIQATHESGTSRTVDIELDNGEEYSVVRTTFDLLDGKGDPVVSFEQFPFMLGWAVTIHKSQGLTFDQVAVDMNRHFGHGMTYVALSRCRKVAGLYLI